MEFRNARFKIKEAEYFLKRIKECYDEEQVVIFYQNAFLISARSIIDYLVQDYFDTIGFDISYKDYANGKKRKQILGRHTDGESVSKFIKQHNENIADFKKEPIHYYFMEKRKIITHHQTTNMGTVSLFRIVNGKRKAIKRYLELNYTSNWLRDHPNLRLDLGKNLSDTDRWVAESILRGNDMYSTMHKFLQDVKKFVAKYEEDYKDLQSKKRQIKNDFSKITNHK